MKVLAISAHPDDETIGAGGTLARHIAEGAEVFWCVATQPHAPRYSDEDCARARAQVLEVQRHYGFADVFTLGFPTVHLNTVPTMELTSALTDVIRKVQPEIVYTTPRDDLNQDHRIVCDATLVAVRPLPNSPVRRVLSYEIATTTRYGTPSGAQPWNPTVWVDISDHLETKLAAMALFETELREFPHPRSLEGLRTIARERGLSVGLPAAEGFELLREVVR